MRSPHLPVVRVRNETDQCLDVEFVTDAGGTEIGVVIRAAAPPSGGQPNE